jgi:hypothetical protein
MELARRWFGALHWFAALHRLASHHRVAGRDRLSPNDGIIPHGGLAPNHGRLEPALSRGGIVTWLSRRLEAALTRFALLGLGTSFDTRLRRNRPIIRWSLCLRV